MASNGGGRGGWVLYAVGVLLLAALVAIQTQAVDRLFGPPFTYEWKSGVDLQISLMSIERVEAKEFREKTEGRLRSMERKLDALLQRQGIDPDKIVQ